MTSDYNDKMKELLYQYAVSLEKYSKELNKAAAELENEKAVNATITVEDIVHKCRGSGGVYGFDELSQKAGQIEDFITGIRKKRKIEKVEMHLLSAHAAGFAKYCRKTSDAIKDSLRFDIEAGTLDPSKIGKKKNILTIIRGLFFRK